MSEALHSSVRSQANATLVSDNLMSYSSRSASTFGQENEIDTEFFTHTGLACCGEELRPFWADDGRFMSLCRRCGQKYTDKTQVRYGGSPWIGVDLDGTLAHDLGNRGLDEIGSPIKPMLKRVQKWIAEGKTVKIFTARASSPRQIAAVKKWLAQHGLPDLEVTNAKDLRMIELWDDRCVQVMTNSGEPVNKESEYKNRPIRRDIGRKGSLYGFVSRLRIMLAL
ncbi:MAG TPA: hypothetical protein VGM58_08285 [Verrucomicrobiae bacterium]|jgi:hypothetical protein